MLFNSNSTGVTSRAKYVYHFIATAQVKFEDIKRVIKSHKWKARQYNGQTENQGKRQTTINKTFQRNYRLSKANPTKKKTELSMF